MECGNILEVHKHSPIERFASSEEFQHDHTKTVDIAFQRILAGHGDLRGSVS